MYIEEEFQELDRLLKKCEPVFLIYVYIKIVEHFDVNFGELVKESIHSIHDIHTFVQRRIEGLNALEDVRKDIVEGLLRLDASHQYKLDRLKMELSFPEISILKKTLQQIAEDKRFANFCMCYFYPSTFSLQLTKTQYERGLHLIDCTPWPPQPQGGFSVDDPVGWALKCSKEAEEKKTNLFYHQSILTYRHNSALVVNFKLIDYFLEYKEYSLSVLCKELLSNYQKVQQLSKTIISKNLAKEGFSEWVFNYIQDRIVGFYESGEGAYDPVITSEDYQGIALQQLDYLYLIDETAYQVFLKRIQGAWNKRTHEKRTREDKLKKQQEKIPLKQRSTKTPSKK